MAVACRTGGRLPGGAIRTLTPFFFYYGIHSLMFGGYPPTAISYTPTAIGYTPTAIGYPPTAIGYTPTAISYPPTAIGYTPMAIGYPPTAIGYPPAAIVGRIGHSNFFFITAPPGASSFLVYDLRVCALCPVHQGPGVSCTGVAQFPRNRAWRQRTAAYSRDRHPESKCTSLRCKQHVNCGSHGTHMLYLDCRHDPVRLTEHLRGTREPQQKKKIQEIS